MVRNLRDPAFGRLATSARASKDAYALFIGAGVSVDAGIPLAVTDIPAQEDRTGIPSIVKRIKRDYYRSMNPRGSLHPDDIEIWYQQNGLLQAPETIYGDALQLIGDTPEDRRNYLHPLFDGKNPTPAHVYLAEMMAEGYFTCAFTTNFDKLMEIAIRELEHEPRLEPRVIEHNESAKELDPTDNLLKVVKLHGDYLFSWLKNTPDETSELEIHMCEGLQLFLKLKGLIVVGYAGNDDSIVTPLEEMIEDSCYFPHALYWVLREGSHPNDRVNKLVNDHPGKAFFISCEDANAFFRDLREALLGPVPTGISPPRTRESTYTRALFDSYKNVLLTELQEEEWQRSYQQLTLVSQRFKYVGGERIPQEQEYDISSAATDNNRLLVLGPPGSGKTTSLKKLAQEHLLSHDIVPIYVELGGYEGDLMALVERSFRGIVDRPLIQEMLGSGNCLILLDGMNEAGPQYSHLARDINALSRMPDIGKNKLVATCRTYNYNDDLQREFLALEIEPLNSYEVYLILQEHLGKNKASRFYDKADAKIRNVLSNPLMLTLLLEYIRVEDEPPRNRAELVDNFLNDFLYKWEWKQGAEIAVQVKKELLSALAHEMGTVTEIKISDARQAIAQRLEDMQQNSTAPAEYSMPQIEHELLTNGLLRQFGGQYSFFHQAIQEYFLAHEIHNYGLPYDQYVGNKDWHESLVFLSGLVPDATDIVTKLIPIDIYIAYECVEGAKKVERDAIEELVLSMVRRYQERDKTGRFIGEFKELTRRIASLEAKVDVLRVLQESFGEIAGKDLWARILQDAGEWDKALEIAEAIASIDQKAGHIERVAISLWQRGKLDEAITKHEEALKLEPRAAWILGNLANALRAADRVDEAESRYRESLSIRDKALTRCNLADLLKEAGREAEAKEEYESAIQLDPEYPKPHNSLGDLYWKRGDYELAEREYALACEFASSSPQYAYLWRDWGNALEKLDRLGEAISAWNRYLDLKPMTSDAASIYQKVKRTRKQIRGCGT